MSALTLQAPEGCRLWLLDLSHPLDTSGWLACEAHEHERARRFRFERDAARYRAAHAWMRQVLSRELGLPPDRLRWTTGEHGKPHLLLEGFGPHAWHFNLSHSDNWALLGLSQNDQIGVDIECLRPMTDMAALVRSHFSPAEQAAFQLLKASEQPTAFLRTWVCKEAGLKALGCGLSLPTQALETRWSPEDWTLVQARTDHGDITLRLHGLQLPDAIGGHAQAAVALVDPKATPSGW